VTLIEIDAQNIELDRSSCNTRTSMRCAMQERGQPVSLVGDVGVA
jgi:hypothetical protein